MKKLAILIPVYNDQKGLDLALSSIDFPSDIKMHVVIVDDGSASPIVLNEIDFPFPIEIIRLGENSGIVRALNRGLEYIVENDFDFVARLDAGDKMLPRRIELQLKKFEENKNLMLVGGAVIFVNKDDSKFEVQKPLTKNEIMKKIWFNSTFCHTAVMFRVSVVKSVGFYSENYPAAEDYEFFWRIAKLFEVANIRDVLVCVDNNPLGISIARRKTQLASRLKVQKENFSLINFRSLLGIIKTILLFWIPLNILGFIKKKIGVLS